MVKVVLVDRTQSNVVDVNNLCFINQSYRSQKLENILLDRLCPQNPVFLFLFYHFVPLKGIVDIFGLGSE